MVDSGIDTFELLQDESCLHFVQLLLHLYLSNINELH